ncbi:MAG: PHB depolymerase family esterase [Bacteroidota bacterium]|jgi:polyhydroxybutyrate depolymerase
MIKKIALVLFLFANFKSNAQISSSISFGGQSRSFIVYAPANYIPGNPVPLVFVLHGLTQTGQAIMNVSNFNSVADTANFILVYPDGISNAWNINANLPGASTADDIGFIETLIDTISANYTIDQNRIYSCGFSAGGFMSHMLACKSSRCFAAIASVAGTMTDSVYNSCAPIFNLPVLQIHGTSDNIVNFNGSLGNKSATDVVDYWKNFNVCNAAPIITSLPNTSLLDFSTVQLLDYSPCSNNDLVQMLKVNGGGHQWPGTSSLLGGLGTINMDINASAEIWKFFSSNACNSSPQGIPSNTPNNFQLESTQGNNYYLKGSTPIALIDIYNTNGQLVFSSKVNLPNELNMDKFTSGMYLLKVFSNNYQTTFKIKKP